MEPWKATIPLKLKINIQSLKTWRESWEMCINKNTLHATQTHKKVKNCLLIPEFSNHIFGQQDFLPRVQLSVEKMCGSVRVGHVTCQSPSP